MAIKQYVEAQINERLESFRRGGENDLKSHTQKADELTSKVKFINNKVNVKNRRIVNAAKSVDEHDVVNRKEIDELSRRLNKQTSFTLEENIMGFNRRFEQLENWKRQCANTVSELYQKVFPPIDNYIDLDLDLDIEQLCRVIMPVLKLVGKGTVLNLDFEHPIHLDDTVKYKVALIGFYSENNIYNLRKTAHVVFTLNDQEEHIITLEPGYWTITKNSDRVTLRSLYNFRKDSNLCTLLGFKADHTGQTGETVTATNPPSLRPMEIVEVHCNIVENSYVSHDVHQHRHQETAVLYQFYPGVLHGYKISECTE
ncbi:hypothetical protein J6590_085772 [Homalodisca vitripennis]|nr:hypothetical protein J6590_085772 [Homalodisca vitripennis]